MFLEKMPRGKTIKDFILGNPAQDFRDNLATAIKETSDNALGLNQIGVMGSVDFYNCPEGEVQGKVREIMLNQDDWTPLEV